jgi:hypothetical protein
MADLDDKTFDAIDMLLRANKGQSDTSFRRGVFRFERKENNDAQIVWYTARKKPGKEIQNLLSEPVKKTLGIDKPGGASRLNFGYSGSGGIKAAEAILHFLYEDEALVENLSMPFYHRFIEKAADNETLTASNVYMWASHHSCNAMINKLFASLNKEEDEVEQENQDDDFSASPGM